MFPRPCPASSKRSDLALGDVAAVSKECREIDPRWLRLAAGIALGLGGAILSTKIIASFLFETSPAEPATFAAVAAMLAAAASLAAWIPARRSATVDPVAALRQT